MVQNSNNKISYPSIIIKAKGDLTKYGYHDIKQLNAKERHDALVKAVGEYGATVVFHKLHALYILHRNTNKTTGELFRRDRNWIGQNYLGGKQSPKKQKPIKMTGGCGCAVPF